MCVRRRQVVRRIREAQEASRVIHYCLLGDTHTAKTGDGEKEGEGGGGGGESNIHRARLHLHNWAQLVIRWVE
jgi:hypothetical protein